jgi:L-ascorbate metabolism protein UlaG (beta-lactamase superfamily)
MIITWFGQSCFRLQDKIGTDGVSVAMDPFDKKIGLKVPNFEADVVTVSHDHYDHNNISALRGTPYVINTAGEYDVKGVLVEGIDSYHDSETGKERGTNIIFRIELDGIGVAHLGDLGHVLDAKQLERLDNIDILLIPVGGVYTIDSKKAVEVVKQIEPRIIIPMHYNLPGLVEPLAEVDNFVKELGLDVTKEDKLKITKKDLPADTMELVLLNN